MHRERIPWSPSLKEFKARKTSRDVGCWLDNLRIQEELLPVSTSSEDGE